MYCQTGAYFYISPESMSYLKWDEWCNWLNNYQSDNYMITGCSFAIVVIAFAYLTISHFGEFVHGIYILIIYIILKKNY